MFHFYNGITAPLLSTLSRQNQSDVLVGALQRYETVENLAVSGRHSLENIQ